MIASDARLKELLRKTLTDLAKTGNATTYKELADRLRLKPPQTIHRLTQALEFLMEEDAVAGRPMLAALCTSRTQPRIPGPGFFLKAQILGVFSGDPTGADAQAYHTSELQRAISFYKD